MNKRIYLCLAHMSGKEQMYIKEAFDTNWVVPLGPNVNGFEKDLEEFVGEGKHVVALSAGTAAVHLALLACGVKPGDEVLVQSFTFCASSHPITYLGATPVFVDSEVDTWNMDPVLLEEAYDEFYVFISITYCNGDCFFRCRSSWVDFAERRNSRSIFCTKNSKWDKKKQQDVESKYSGKAEKHVEKYGISYCICVR